MTLTMPRSTVEVEVYTRTQVQGAGIGSQTVNSGEEVALSCQVRMGNRNGITLCILRKR